MKLTAKTYDVLKSLALVWLPVFGTLYFALARVWGLPAAQEVVNTIIAVDTFLGVTLYVSTTKYNSKRVGDIKVQELEDGAKTYSLNLEGQPEEIEKVDEARFTVLKGEQPIALADHRTGRRRKSS